MAKYTKEQVLEWFEGKSAAQAKVKSMFQGLKLANKPLEIEDSKENIIKTVETKLAKTRKSTVSKNINEAVRNAYKFGVSEEEVVTAIKMLYKEKINEKYNKKMQDLENQIAALKAKML